MAEIGPFRAWRYNTTIGNIADLTCPLFDVVQKEELADLYKNPYNSIHLSLPENTDEIHQTIDQWKREHILLQDELPAIYVYYQYYKIPGAGDELKCRKGFICNIRLHDWQEGIILRHENIMPHSVNDRLELLEKSEMNISPTHGMYTDTDLILEPYMDECIKKPLYEFTDYQGVLNKLAVIQDLDIIKKFKKLIKDKPIILADGHHRYTASLEYRKKIQANTQEHPEKIMAAEFHCMYLTNTESNDISIFPTHRIINNLPDFNQEEILTKLNTYFEVELVENPYSIKDKISDYSHTFGIVFKDKSLIIKLKKGAINELNWSFPEEVKNLDLTVLHFFIIEKALKIRGKDQKNSKNINFSFNFTRIISDALAGIIQMGIITRDISIDEVKRICYSGFTFPHKSTFFYPKVVCGLLFHSVANQDFFIEQALYKKELNV